MEIQHIALAISVANFALTWGVALYMYLANKNKVTNARIDTLEQDLNKKIEKLDDDVELRLDEYREKIARLEEGTEHGPTHHDLGLLHEKFNGVGNDVSLLRGEVNGVKQLLHTIHEHLLRVGK